MQPGRRGSIIVLRRPIGNRAEPKICGVMPSRVHATMFVKQLEKAESVVKDLFLEATDDGIEALDAVLLACYEEVMRKGPRVAPHRTTPGMSGILAGGSGIAESRQDAGTNAETDIDVSAESDGRDDDADIADADIDDADSDDADMDDADPDDADMDNGDTGDVGETGEIEFEPGELDDDDLTASNDK
jgi:hypothetical protein